MGYAAARDDAGEITMTWFSALLFFECEVIGSPESDPLCEKSVRIFQAAGEEEAMTKAEEIGRGAEHEYSNEEGQTVVWRFVRVLEVQDLAGEELGEGMEVFSRLMWMRSEDEIGGPTG